MPHVFHHPPTSFIWQLRLNQPFADPLIALLIPPSHLFLRDRKLCRTRSAHGGRHRLSRKEGAEHVGICGLSMDAADGRFLRRAEWMQFNRTAGDPIAAERDEAGLEDVREAERFED